jgi:hypothetical protein
MNRRRCFLLLLAAALTGLPPALAEDESSPEALKSAFLLNFLQFVIFPGGAPAAYQLCLLAGSAPLPGLAESNSHLRTVRGLPVAVREHVAPRDARRCHLIYVDQTVRSQLSSVVEAIGSRPVMIVTDFPGGAPLGATISLVLREDGRMGFDVNRSGAQQQGLELSAQLLKLARRIY